MSSNAAAADANAPAVDFTDSEDDDEDAGLTGWARLSDERQRAVLAALRLRGLAVKVKAVLANHRLRDRALPRSLLPRVCTLPDALPPPRSVPWETELVRPEPKDPCAKAGQIGCFP